MTAGHRPARRLPMGRRLSVILAVLVALAAATLVFTGNAFGVGDAPDDARAGSARDAESRDLSEPIEEPAREAPFPPPPPPTTAAPRSPAAAPRTTATATPAPPSPTTSARRPPASAPTTSAPAPRATSTASTAPVVRYADFDSTTGLTLNGAAARAGSALRLTPDRNSLAGTAWSGRAIDGRQSFSTTFRVHLHDAADGIAFLVQSEGPKAIGDQASFLGYSDYHGTELRIRPSLAVEFDTYGNPWDPNRNHVGVVSHANIGKHLSHGRPAFDMASGVPFTAWVDYDAARDRLSVYVSQGRTKPGTPITTTTIDLAAMFGSRPVYAGFTGATGGLSAAQDILSWSLSTS